MATTAAQPIHGWQKQEQREKAVNQFENQNQKNGNADPGIVAKRQQVRRRKTGEDNCKARSPDQDGLHRDERVFSPFELLIYANAQPGWRKFSNGCKCGGAAKGAPQQNTHIFRHSFGIASFLLKNEFQVAQRQHLVQYQHQNERGCHDQGDGNPTKPMPQPNGGVMHHQQWKAGPARKREQPANRIRIGKVPSLDPNGEQKARKREQQNQELRNVNTVSQLAVCHTITMNR